MPACTNLLSFHLPPKNQPGPDPPVPKYLSEPFVDVMRVMPAGSLLVNELDDVDVVVMLVVVDVDDVVVEAVDVVDSVL